MSNYVKTTDFASKDALASGNPLKTIKGTEFDVEFNNLATASATKANTAAPDFTGIPTAPTAGAANNTQQIATTAFVFTAVSNTDTSAFLPKAGGAMTGPITTNSTIDGVEIAVRNAVLTTTKTTADAALPKTGGTLTGAILTNSTFDGRNVATDGATADAALPKTGGTMTGAILTNSTFDGVDIAVRDAVLTTTKVKADAAQVPPVVTATSVTIVPSSFHVVSTAGITLTLPINPTAGIYVTIKDGTGDAEDYPFTVARNGSNIASSATDLTFDKNFAEIVMTYINNTIGWSV